VLGVGEGDAVDVVDLLADLVVVEAVWFARGEKSYALKSRPVGTIRSAAATTGANSAPP
jgi:hypothetical protein